MIQPATCHGSDLAQALLLELRIADRQHLVDDQDFRFQCAATAKASRTYMPLE